MAGGTSVPPQDSRCEPWSGQRKDFWLEKEKTCGRTKRSRRSDEEVSLDNADAVIEGCPILPVFGTHPRLRINGMMLNVQSRYAAALESTRTPVRCFCNGL